MNTETPADSTETIRLQTERIKAETAKLQAEAEKLQAEERKHFYEALQLQASSRWGVLAIPVGLATVLSAVMFGLGAIVSKLWGLH